MPAFELLNTCREGRYRIEKEIVSDPQRDTVLQKTRFVALRGVPSDYRLYVLLAPHLGNQGCGNTGWIGEYDGHQLLFAYRDGNAIALACSAVWAKRSVGFVGSSDGWRDLQMHRQITCEYARAENGNIALLAEIDLSNSKSEFVIALGFGKDSDEAAENAIASLKDGFAQIKKNYIASWQQWSPKVPSAGNSIKTVPDFSAQSLNPRTESVAVTIHDSQWRDRFDHRWVFSVESLRKSEARSA